VPNCSGCLSYAMFERIFFDGSSSDSIQLPFFSKIALFFPSTNSHLVRKRIVTKIPIMEAIGWWDEWDILHAWQIRNSYGILVDKLEGKRPLGKLNLTREDNTQMDFKQIGYGGVNWIQLDKDDEHSGSIKWGGGDSWSGERLLAPTRAFCSIKLVS
jgi:hypothetical protein